jgi:hypothetical protein
VKTLLELFLFNSCPKPLNVNLKVFILLGFLPHSDAHLLAFDELAFCGFLIVSSLFSRTKDTIAPYISKAKNVPLNAVQHMGPPYFHTRKKKTLGPEPPPSPKRSRKFDNFYEFMVC